MNTTPTLEGHGMRLIPLERAHLSALTKTHDASTWQWMSESGATPDLLAAFIDRGLAQAESGNAQVWTSTLLEPDGSARVVGCTRLADWNQHHRTGEIGWTWIAPDLRGTGANARVKLLQLRHCFETLKLRRVALKTHHNNLRSQRAMEKIGATFEGVFRNHMIMPDGTSRDTHWFSIIDREWPTVEALLLDRIAREPLHTR
ncbi:GNAT family N-acetyltransferase [Terriglobus aquaticus]|uniref:GNAT family N-acetyltransferase n=1 Tax=Terriglobus aquaticus TaxID=940139 RepID=A0ABW9KKF0_9BACT|nr:GNAT family protein [Terriglobus aquaticus]